MSVPCGLVLFQFLLLLPFLSHPRPFWKSVSEEEYYRLLSVCFFLFLFYVLLHSLFGYGTNFTPQNCSIYGQKFGTETGESKPPLRKHFMLGTALPGAEWHHPCLRLLVSLCCIRLVSGTSLSLSFSPHAPPNVVWRVKVLSCKQHSTTPNKVSQREKREKTESCGLLAFRLLSFFVTLCASPNSHCATSSSSLSSHFQSPRECPTDCCSLPPHASRISALSSFRSPCPSPSSSSLFISSRGVFCCSFNLRPPVRFKLDLRACPTLSDSLLFNTISGPLTLDENMVVGAGRGV